MEGNLLVVHGGGPTAVLNASLYGVIREAQASPDIQKIYGAIGGSEAILTENFLDRTAAADTGNGNRFLAVSVRAGTI